MVLFIYAFKLYVIIYKEKKDMNIDTVKIENFIL